MSRVVKGGQKFKPVARPKVARPTPTPTPQPESQPAGSSQDVPSSSQVPELTQSSTQASSVPSSSFPATPGGTQPPSGSLPSGKPSSTSGPSTSASTSSQAIPLPPARAYNPYLHDSAPPPIIIREPVRSQPSSQPSPSSRPQGRGPPSIASTPEPSSVRAGSVVPTIATTQAGPPPSPGGGEPSNRARAPPSIASTPVAQTPPPPASPAAPARAARPPAIATVSDAQAMPPPAVVPKGKGKGRALHPPAPEPVESEPVASTSASPEPAPATLPTPRGRGRGLKKSVLDLPTQPVIAPPVSAERGGPSDEDEDGNESEAQVAALPLGARSVRRNAPPAATGRGKKRGAAAGATGPAAKRARGKRAVVADDEDEMDLLAVEGEDAANEPEDDQIEGSDIGEAAASKVASKRGKGKARAPPRSKAGGRKRLSKAIIDSDEDTSNPVPRPEVDEDGDTDDAPVRRKRKAPVRKPRDPDAPPPKKRKPPARDEHSNIIPRPKRKSAKRKVSAAGSDSEGASTRRAPKAPMQGPLNEAGDPIPRPPRVRKPRGIKEPKAKKAKEEILDLAGVEAHNAAVGDGPDAATTTMKDICNDTGIGRISSRYIEIQKKAMDIKEARKQARLRMKARLSKAKHPGENDSEDEDGPLTLHEGGNAPNGAYVRPEHAAGSAAALDALAAEAKAAAKEAKRAANEAAGIENDPEDDDDDIDGVAEGAYAPQFRLVNGEMVLDQESLVADRHAETEARGDDALEMVEERDTDRFVNSTTWGKKLRGERWNAAETDLFYDAINQFGTDFEMIARLFPGRTRKMIKNKWNREETTDATRVTNALMNKIPVDMATYSRMTRTDLSGPPPVFDAPPPPPPRPTTPGSAGPPKVAPKRKRVNPRDGEEVVGMVGEDGEVVRADGYESPPEENAGPVNVPSWAKAKKAAAPVAAGGSDDEEMPHVSAIGR